MLWRESNRDTTILGPREAAEITPPPAADTGTLLPTSGAPTYASATRPSRNSGPLPSLSNREAARRFKPHGTVEAQLDLHGSSKLEAYERVQQFLLHAQRAGLRHVLIITGKGRSPEAGVLRNYLPDWLNEPPLRSLISGIMQARPEKGGSGVTHVLLKRL